MDIKKILSELVEVRYKVRIDDTEELFGNRMNLTAGELLYLLFDIEEKFQIKICDVDITYENFKDISSMALMIEKYI